MNTSRALRCLRPFNKRMYSDVEKKLSHKDLVSNAQSMYQKILPIVLPITIIGSLMTTPVFEDKKNTQFENWVYSVSIGVITGMTFPLSFPLITLNLWRRNILSPTTKEKKGEPKTT